MWLVQLWWNLYQSKVLLLSFFSISIMAAEVLNKVVWNVFNGFCTILDRSTLIENISRKISLLQSYTTIRVQNYSYVQHSCTVSHGRWGNHTRDGACQVGGVSTIRVFYIACKRSCWWVKVFIVFLKARLSCQTNASVSRIEKWSGLWTIANTGESWFGCQWDDRQVYV